MIKFILPLVLFSSVAFAGKTGTWSGSTIHQFFPTIITALLGNGYSLVSSQSLFGDGADGVQVMGASGTTTLARDMYWTALSWPVASTAVISVQNQRIFVNGTCDFTNAPVGALDGTGNTGGNGAAGGGNGAAGANTAAGTNVGGHAGGAGGAGAATAGAQGSAGTGGNDVACVVGTSGAGGNGGAGGAGGGGAGGAQRGQAACAAWPMRDVTYWFTPQSGAGAVLLSAGSGSGGAGGGGDATTSGAGGGGGGAAGNTVYLSCKTIITGGSTPAATIRANGGNGGVGGSPNGTCTAGCGGGGGGGGGSGGWVVVKYVIKTGNAVSNFITATGGTGGTGGTHKNTGGVDGNAGNALATSQPGLIQLVNLSTGAITSSTSGNTTL